MRNIIVIPQINTHQYKNAVYLLKEAGYTKEQVKEISDILRSTKLNLKKIIQVKEELNEEKETS